MATVSLFWNTYMATVLSCENALLMCGGTKQLSLNGENDYTCQ